MFLRRLFVIPRPGREGQENQEQRGASLMEMLFAIAITALVVPFAYRQITDVGVNLRTLGIAKQLVEDAIPVRNHIRLFAAEFPEDQLIEVETDDELERIYVYNADGSIAAFVVTKAFRDDILTAHRIANLIGTDAAVVDAHDHVAYGVKGDWAVALPDIEPGDIVHRIVIRADGDDTAKFLHRTVSPDNELSTMERDLSMGNFSIGNIHAIEARTLAGTDLDTFLVRVPAIITSALYFANGVNLNPAQSTIRNIRVTGDATGFRNFFTDSFNSSSGQLTTERAVITERLTVSRRFEVNSPFSRTVSGFAGVSAGSVRTAYLDASVLTFLPGFGLTVSSELLYSTTPPIRLGNWSFPSNAVGPRFTSLRLGNMGTERIVGRRSDFSTIMREGWQ